MEKYNYFEAVKADALEYIRDNFTAAEIAERLEDRNEWECSLNDALWVTDSVTGNASGSYYCNAWKAAEALAHNWDILVEALIEFGCDLNAIECGEEYCDVTIRCYLLGQAIAAALDELESEA